jgi:hypothetical protein
MLIQKTKSITDTRSYKKLIPMVELHSSLWLDDMKNYKVQDFIGQGIVAQNPDILKGDAGIIKKLKMAQWNVVPMVKDFEKKGLALQNYIYLYDTEDGIDIYHYEPLKPSQNVKEIKRNNTNIFHTTFTESPAE